ADQIEGLENEANFAIADARAVVEIETCDRLAVEDVVSFRGRIEQAKNGQERGLPAAGGSGNSEVFAFFDFEIDGRERVGFKLGCEEDFADFLHFDERAV